MLQELLQACDDIEMLEEMIGVKNKPEDENGELNVPKRRKSKLLQLDCSNVRQMQQVINQKRRKILYQRAIKEEKRKYWENQLTEEQKM